MPILTYFSLIFTMFLWGGTFIAGRLLAGAVEPASAAFLRFLIASVAMVAVTRSLEGKFHIPPPKLWLPLILLGMTGVFAYNVFFFYGLHHISAGRASLIVAGTPLVITIFAALFLRERLTFLKTCGVLVSLAGAVMVISNGHPGSLFTGGFGRGEQALIGCVVSWSAYSLIGRSVLNSLPPLTTVCYSSIIGTILLAFPAAREGLFGLHLSAITFLSWTSLAYLGLFGTALGFSLYYKGIKKIGASRAGIFINLVPVFSLLLSWLILGETIRPAVLVGGILVLAGVTLTNYRRAGT
ncbi:MAG: DMT family transporter [Proteobacteria bacterium]|nr:DMT family transporter [Pseudomonadota bacterium]